MATILTFDPDLKRKPATQEKGDIAALGRAASKRFSGYGDRERPVPAKAKANRRERESAEILFFVGVRYERM